MRVFFIKRPVLIIPGFEGDQRILEWEKKNTQYKMDTGWYMKKVEAEEYFNYGLKRSRNQS